MTAFKINDSISGISKSYDCWSISVKKAIQDDIQGENFICIVTRIMIFDNKRINDYLYIKHFNSINDFIKLNFKNYSVLDFLFISTLGLSKTEIENIIVDIKSKFSGNSINDLDIQYEFDNAVI